jgi:flavorubredoxin
MLERSMREVLGEQTPGVSGYKYMGEFNPGMHWVKICIEFDGIMNDLINRQPDWYEMGRKIHTPFSQFLIEDDQTLLIDAGAPTQTNEFPELIGDILDGAELDYLVLSHPDVDHTGNVGRLLETYPNLTLVAPNYGSGHDIYYLEDAMPVSEGDTIDIGDHTISFHDAPLVDSAMTCYVVEESTRTFFPVDFPTIPHQNGECHLYADEIDGLKERMYYVAIVEFFWFEWANTEKLKAEFDRMLDEYQPKTIAPSHSPIFRTEEDSQELLKFWRDELIEDVKSEAQSKSSDEFRLQLA